MEKLKWPIGSTCSKNRSGQGLGHSDGTKLDGNSEDGRKGSRFRGEKTETKKLVLKRG